MKKPASTFKILGHLFMASVIFLLIYLLSGGHPWIKATLFMVWGVYFFIDFLKLVLIGTKHSLSGAYILFYTGCLFEVLFLIWLGNLVIKEMLNPLFNLAAWEFQIGSLFTGIYQYVFSVPSLLAGVVLIISGALWENNAQYHEWYQGLFPGSRKKMFRREF